MSKDNSPKALAWGKRRYISKIYLDQICMLESDATCREMWLQCDSPWLLYTITYHLKSWNEYKDVRDWFMSITRQGSSEEADLFRAKCKKLVWDKRKK